MGGVGLREKRVVVRAHVGGSRKEKRGHHREGVGGKESAELLQKRDPPKNMIETNMRGPAR